MDRRQLHEMAAAAPQPVHLFRRHVGKGLFDLSWMGVLGAWQAHNSDKQNPAAMLQMQHAAPPCACGTVLEQLRVQQSDPCTHP